MSKRSKLSTLLEKLNVAGYDVDKTSRTRSWVKKLYIHVAQYITPLVHEGSDDVTYQIIRNFVSSVTKEDDHVSRLPLKGETSKLSEVKQETNSFQSTLKQGDYSAQDDTSCNSMSMDFTGATVEHSKLLIGVLNTAGSIKKHLYICDKSDRILCHMVAPTPELLNTVVFVENWRFLPPAINALHGAYRYIEVLSEPVCLYRIKISKKDADLGKTRDFEGFVTSVSSCLDVKQWRYVINFVFENKDFKPVSRTLLLKNEFAFWSSCVHRGDKIKISNLKCASLMIEEKKFDVLVPISCSELHIVKSAIGNDQILSMDAIHKQMSRILSIDSATEEGICPVYLGEITLIKSAEFGIYLLDDKVLLHCAYNIFGDLGCAVRPGALILVVKAHVCQGSDGLIHLVCCARTSLHIIRYSQSTTSWQPCYVSGNILLQKFLLFEPFFQHPITTSTLPKFLDKLCTIYGFPIDMLSPIVTSDEVDNNEFKILIRLLLKDPQSNEISKFGSRLPFTENLSDMHNDHCIVNKMLKKPQSHFYLMTIKELIDMAVAKTDMHRGQSKVQNLWLHHVMLDEELSPGDLMSYDSTLFLLGTLSVDSKNESLQLTDSTACLDLIALENDATTIASTLGTNDIGGLVRITEFQIVVEFLTKQKPPIVVTCLQDIMETSEASDSSLVEEPTRKLYIVCELSGIEVLRRSNGCVDNWSRYLGCCDKTQQKDDIARERESASASDELNATKQKRQLESHTGHGRVLTVSEINIDPPSPSCSVNVRGTVESRTVYEENYMIQTRFKIFDINTRMSICIYVGESSFDDIAGIIPGSTVIFHNIRIMISSWGNVYAKFNDSSRVRLECLNVSRTQTFEHFDNEIDWNEVPSCLLVNTYSNEVGNRLLKVKVSPIKTLKVIVSFQMDNARNDEDLPMSFYAKCSITDATARMYLHFYTNSTDCFFRFLEIPNVVQKDFLRICKDSKSTRIEYDSILHDKENNLTELGASEEDPFPQHYLTFLCGHANALILQRKEVIVRRKSKPKAGGFHNQGVCSGTEDYFEHGTTAVGSQGQDHMHSYNLKSLHFNCVHVF